jgi:hypothetical protein
MKRRKGKFYLIPVNMRKQIPTTGQSLARPGQSAKIQNSERTPLDRNVLVESNFLKLSFDVYECLCPCNECSRSYSGAGLKVRCLGPCHRS